MNSQKYVLLIEPEDVVLSLQTTALSCFYPGAVYSSKNTNGAIEILKLQGDPEIIFADVSAIRNASGFHKLLTENFSHVPVIATAASAANPDQTINNSGLTAIIEKNLTAAAFTYLVKSLTSTITTVPEYIPVSTSIILRMGIVPFDLYLKLSDNNLVKIFHKGETFLEEDADKLTDKSISELHLRYSESSTLLSFLESELTSERGEKEEFSIALENLEEFERVARIMKWSPEIKLSAQKTVSQVIKILSKNKKVINVLRDRLKSRGSPYSRHIGLLSYLVCAVSSKLTLGESVQIKLTLASLTHDVAVDDYFYENIKEWNKRARDLTDKSPDAIKYRMHPYEATRLVKTLDWVSPDVEQIILQHHETKDGKGFPRGLDAARIGHLPALFIIVEDLVEFIVNGENLETSITDFVTWGRVFYDAGHFKKIFTTLEETLDF